MTTRAILGAAGLSAAMLTFFPGRPLVAGIATASARAHAGSVSRQTEAPRSNAPMASCPPGTLPDGAICIHLPAADAPEAAASEAGHHDRHGTWNVYEQIPRRPDRPADYEAYRYPIPPGVAGRGLGAARARHVVSGYDLDLPDEAQRRGPSLRAVGHGGVDLPQQKGTPVHLVDLDAQQGDAEIVYVGPLFGTTVVTRQTIREGGRLRDYLVLFGHLDRPAPGIAARVHLHDGDVLGFVGDTGSPELVHLHLETRRVRDGVDVTKLPPARLLDASVSVVCDPRNVLPRAR